MVMVISSSALSSSPQPAERRWQLPANDQWHFSILGGNISKPITGETTYTLSYVDAGGQTLIKTAPANILPTFQEL